MVEWDSLTPAARSAILNINFRNRMPYLYISLHTNRILGIHNTEFVTVLGNFRLFNTSGDVEAFLHNNLSGVLGRLEDLVSSLDEDFESSDENSAINFNDTLIFFGLIRNLF